MWRTCYQCAESLSRRDESQPDIVAGVPDQALPMPLVMPMRQGFLCPSLYQTIPGPDPSCPRTRGTETSLPA